MNARVLRKWSLTKFLMYLWLLPVIMLLVIWSQSATSMHLSTNTRRSITLLNHHQNQQIDNIMLNDDQQKQQQQLLLLSMFDHQKENQQNNNNKMRQEAYLKKLNSPVISNYNNNNNQQQQQQQQQLQQQQQENPFEVFINIDTDSDVANVAANAANDIANVPHVPKLNSQVIINLNSLTRSANLDTLSSSSSSNRNSNSQDKKFRRQYNIQSQQDLLLLPSTDNRVQHSKINQNHHQNQQQQQQHKSQEYSDYVDELISNEKSNRSSKITSSSSSSSSSSISVKESRNHENYERVSSPSPPQIINSSTNSSSTTSSSSNNNRNQRRRTLQNDRLSMMMMMKKMIENDNSNENAAAIDNAAARIPNPMMNLEQQKIITANERLLQQREKRARTNAHRRRRLIRLKQLSSTNNYIRTIKPTTITVPRLEASESPATTTTITTTTTETSPNQAIIDNDLNKLMIGRNRRDSRLLYSQSAYSRQQRKRPRRYCSARDPTQLAFEAPTVFEGKIISMSYDRRANFSVTFEVKEIFKKQPGYVLPHLLRLQFTYRNTSGECDIYREHMRPRGLVRDELEQGRVYILFVQQINSGNFTILGQPIKKTRRAVEAVKTGVSENYAQPASIKSLTASKTLVQNGEELRIVCRVRGQPPPKVTWFKDDKSINRNRRLYHFIHLKKRSELVVKSFNSSDAGLYECRAKNKVFRKPEKRTIRIEAFSRPADESYSHSTGDECTGNFEQYCLNGGTCQYFREISVPSCECPDGFVGDRCQEKEWNNVTPSTYQKENQQCGENKYYGSYYC